MTSRSHAWLEARHRVVLRAMLVETPLRMPAPELDWRWDGDELELVAQHDGIRCQMWIGAERRGGLVRQAYLRIRGATWHAQDSWVIPADVLAEAEAASEAADREARA